MVLRTGVGDVQSGILRPPCNAVYQVPHNCNVIQRVGVLSSVAQHRTSKAKREIREQATFAGLSAFAMHEHGWLGVYDSEDEQLCASAACKQGWAAVDELGDLSMDDTGWQDVALQEDGAVSNEEDGLVQAAAQAADPQGGQLEDLHGHGLSLRLVDPSVAKERSEWSKSRLLKPLQGAIGSLNSL